MRLCDGFRGKSPVRRLRRSMAEARIATMDSLPGDCGGNQSATKPMLKSDEAMAGGDALALQK